MVFVFYTKKFCVLCAKQQLLEKKNSESMTGGEEEELKKVFNILKAYGEVDEVPSAMLESGLSERVDKLLGELDRLLKK